MFFAEGIFRRPRIQTNRLLRKHAALFKGDIINVSGADDFDKQVGIRSYLSNHYDEGNEYRTYFSNARSYSISNYPYDTTDLNAAKDNLVYIDLEEELDSHLVGKFDVVLNHTVLEHVFDIFLAFKNLCLMSKDIVILIVPQFQMLHDFNRGYKDYWRFTPFSIEKLFSNNGFTVLYRNATHGFSESTYLYTIASKKPDTWKGIFGSLVPIEQSLNNKNNGAFYTLFSLLQMKVELLVRKHLSRT